MRVIIQNIILSTLGLLLVRLFRRTYAPTSSIDPYWVLGGIVVGGALLVFQKYIEIGQSLHRKINKSITNRIATILASFVLLTFVVFVGQIQFTPEWLSGMAGLSISLLLVIPLYLWG